MADGDEEKVIEEQLQLQLNEQKDTLETVVRALESDPQNSDLQSIHSELVQSIKDAEEGLFHLKRSRLLREADSFLQGSVSSSDDPKVEPIVPADVQAEELEDQSYAVGSKCRFRHSDGRWYNGIVVGLEGSDCAKIAFLNPTIESMLMCKFFLQQRCRFGSNCRLSHGIDVPISSLKSYFPTLLDHSLVGSSIWALSDSKIGIWREAELESWDEKLRTAGVVFRDNGTSTMLETESITLSKYASPASDEEDTDTSSEQSYSSGEEDSNSPQGLGFLERSTLQRGIQTETAIFASWENHTRGIASKMMANMGYREGMGLGASGQGMLNPIPVKVLKPKQSLDHALQSIQPHESNDSIRAKKRSRGGKRKRDKKIAAAIKAAQEEEESRDVFSIINDQLAMHKSSKGNSSKKKHSKANGEEKKEDRRALLAYEDEIKNLRMQVEKLEEMANRNRKEKVVYEAAMRKLDETRSALADAEAARESTSSAVARKESEKKWVKF